jgi:hypothetical protein
MVRFGLLAIELLRSRAAGAVPNEGDDDSIQSMPIGDTGIVDFDRLSSGVKRLRPQSDAHEWQRRLDEW